MTGIEHKPNDESIAAIKEQLVAYETQRAVEQRYLRLFMPVSLIPAVVIALLGIAMLLTAEDAPLGADDKFEFALWVCLAVVFLGSGGLWLAHQPARRLQQRLRDRMLPALFGFVGEVEYAHAKTPFSFSHIPKGVLPGHTRTEFGDVVRGRHKWMRFELFEVELKTGGKNNRTVFDGVIVGFEIPARFPGLLLATPTVGEWSMFFRDLFGAALTTVVAGDTLIDAAFEFRTDNSLAAKPLVAGPLGRALATVRDTWREGPPRIALSETTGFLVMPTRKNFFELPGVSVPASYEQHVEPMVAELTMLLDTALLMRRAMAGHDGPDEEPALLD